MSENPNPNEFVLDAEDWQIAFEPFKGHPGAVLQLAFHFVELKRHITNLNMHEAIASMDRAIDGLYEHSDFRSVSRELFQTGIEGNLTVATENLLRELGIKI